MGLGPTAPAVGLISVRHQQSTTAHWQTCHRSLSKTSDTPKPKPVISQTKVSQD